VGAGVRTEEGQWGERKRSERGVEIAGEEGKRLEMKE
jgi:hypothetical protein